MERLAITGRGLITPLGNGLTVNEQALQNGVSGIRFMPEWRDVGLESQVAGTADADPASPLINPKNRRFMTANSRMAAAAAGEALAEAGVSLEDLRGLRVALILGCAGSAYSEIVQGANLFLEHKKVKRVSPFTVPRVMPSSAVANLSLLLGIRGESFDVSSACASSTHAIMIGDYGRDGGARLGQRSWIQRDAGPFAKIQRFPGEGESSL
jgi:3-oxoacyl-[acyl-carrier-protein] synthase-1